MAAKTRARRKATERPAELRERMVREQIMARGVANDAVLQAMREVPREAFVAPEMVEFAYDDAPLPIDEEQTISQPYIVAAMAEALEVGPEDRVLDVGTGSGYAAAVLARAAAEVYTVERHRSLAESARRRFEELGLDNVHVRVGDGSLGWEEEAPFDAINVAAAGPDVPPTLKEQLAPGGRMIIPTGETPHLQRLLRIRNTPRGLREEALGDVRFVPLVGAEGWTEEGERTGAKGPGEGGRPEGGPASPGGGGRTTAAARVERRATAEPRSAAERIAGAAEPFGSIDEADLEPLLDRIGDARVVLLGEATHGTSEFYRMRSRITRELVEEHDFDFVAVEADWPEAARIDAFIRHEEARRPQEPPFDRFPRWMWLNEEVRELVAWLRRHNEGLDPDDRVGFHGLDLYSLHTSIDRVVEYLEEVDPDAAEAARARYGCLTPWQQDAASYGRAVLGGRHRECEDEVVTMLKDVLEQRVAYTTDGDARRQLDAEQNARLVANAERYYRVMYYGGRASWNLRDQHMFDTLEDLLDFHGPDSRAVVWEHNSHIGDASATEMGARGEHNVGQLARQRFGPAAHLVGFGTHTGTVAAAHDWGDPVELMDVRPSHERSYERLCHDSGVPRFVLPLRETQGDATLRRELLEERLERAIGVVYRPGTELASHYFHAALPRQFDEYVWFDETRAVTPLTPDPGSTEPVPDTYPFAL